MTLNVKIDKDPRVELKIRRTIEGNFIIMDHEDMDIVLIPEKNKCISFPKEAMSDKVYSSQDRMFNFLAKKGLISQSTIRGANVFGAMEAELYTSKIPGIDRDQAFLYTIHEYLEQEKPYFKQVSDYDDARLDSLIRPGEEDSTELGDLPHSDTKGSMYAKMRPYGYMYNYSLVRENESESKWLLYGFALYHTA